MKIDIFDVGHGACSVITAPSGKRVMIDCGRRTDPYWWPSIHYQGQTVDVLVLTNLDEDHVNDFRDVCRNVRIGSVWMNDNITASHLGGMKLQGMQDGVRAVHQYLCRPARLNGAADLSPMKVTLFRNMYGMFADTNNLSLVTFVEYANFCIVYPGDLETEGWKALLTNALFRDHLRRVNIFVTSHHGRENGCCEEVFEFCHPDAFVISDKESVHDTQETTGWYRYRAKGLWKILRSAWETPEVRYVFTTRGDRCISIDVDPTGRLVLRPKSNSQGALSYLPDYSDLARLLLAGRTALHG